MNSRCGSRNFVPAALFLVALALTPLLLHSRRPSGELIAPGARHSMGDFSVQRLDGTPWHLSEHRGHIVLINFWATWCGPCREELPGLAALAHANSPRTVSVLGISLDHSGPEPVRDFAARLQLPYPVALADATTQLDQIPTGIPTSLLLDRSGRVARVYTGPTTQAQFQQDIDRLVREPAPR